MLFPWSRSCPRRCEEQQQLMEAAPATVSHASGRRTRPSAPRSDSSCPGRRSLSWKRHGTQRRLAGEIRAAGTEGANSLFQDGHDGFQNGVKDIQKDGVSCAHKPSISYKSHSVHLLTMKYCSVKPKINILDEKQLLWVV